MSFSSPHLLATTVGQDRHIAIYNGERVVVHMLDDSGYHLVRRLECDFYDPSAPLSSLHFCSASLEETTYLLIGISKSCKRAFIWKLECGERMELEGISFIGTQDFDWDHEPGVVEVTSAAYGATTTFSLLASLESAGTSTTTLAVSIGSDVICYRLVQNDDRIQWQELYTVQTQLKSIQCVRRTANTLAIVSEAEDGSPGQLLSVWMEIRTDVPPVQHKSQTFSEPVLDIAWDISSDGQFILAVAFARKIGIYGEKRATTVNDDFGGWISYVTFDVDTPDDISGISWLNYGVLAVAAGNQLRCYLKWLTQEDGIKQLPPSDAVVKPMTNIYDESFELNGALPLYHPNHLIHYLMWGKLELINAVLLSLYKFLRRIIDEDDISVDRVPQLTLSTVLKLQNDTEQPKKKKEQYNTLFGSPDDTDDYLGIDDGDNTRPLTQQETKYLIEQLERRRLPSLSGNETIHLVAMIDTFVEISTQGESLDENGARFTALVENYFHLNKVLPLEQRSDHLQPRDMAWALHSQSQDLLLERCLRLCGGKLLWNDARSLGIFMWLQKSEVVAEQLTNIARNTYLKQDIKDPVDCTLFYLALRKKSLLQSLWRAASHHKEQAAMVKFLANNFSEPRWQTAAAKNAFVLLGRQRYEYAAAFFLLADKLKDAVGIILKNLKDYQLAIAICRVYEGDHSPLLKEILRNHVLPIAIETGDRWLLSMTHTMLNEPREAIRTLVVPLSECSSTHIPEDDTVANVSDPNLFIMYRHLKEQLRVQNQQGLEMSPMLEYTFSLRVSRAYERLGCPLLALYILSKCKRPAQALTTSESKQETMAQNGAPEKESRAADLFADDEPARAADLFAENDIFASSSSKSNADDIFADEPSISKADDIFGDDDWLKKYMSTEDASVSGEQDTSDQASVASEKSTTEPENVDDSLDVYKALLVMRLFQVIFHNASAIYDSAVAPMLSADRKYEDSFMQMQQDIMSLAESVKISPAALDRLLMEKSIETDVFSLYLRMIDAHSVSAADAKAFMNAFKTGCLQVFRSALNQQDYNYSGLAFMEHWSERVMSSYYIWSKIQQDISFSQAQKISLNAYVTMIMVTLKQRHFEKAWSFLSNFKNLLESLSSPDTIQQGFDKSHLNEEMKTIDMDPDDFDAFSDDTLFGYNMDEEVYRPMRDCNDRSAGSNLLEVAALNYVLSILEGYMQHAEKRLESTGELISFIWMVMLDPIAYRAHGLKDVITAQLEGDFTKRNMSRELKSLRQKKFWRSLKSLRTQERLLPFINFAPPDINVLPDDTVRPPQTLYNTPTTAHAFAVSSVHSDIVAVCMKTEIQEIDLAGVEQYGAHMVRSTSFSSSGIAQEHHRHHHHTDSYPDTEEEDDFGFSDTETDGLSSRQTRQRSKSHHLPHHRGPFHGKTPSSSAGASPGSVRLGADSVKNAQSHNLENLHETLKRSLRIGKDGTSGSEASRSPAGASSTGSVADMVTLKRTAQTTCAEAHPYFPYYITGCEITSNGGPSVNLWQFGQEQEIANYHGCHGKVTRVHFDRVGQRFGAGDTTGGLLFWRFDSHAHSSKPYYSLTSCHTKATRDFTYLDSSSLVATAGTSVAMSRRRDHVCLWDTLLPPSKAMVCALPAHDNGAYAIAYEAKRRLLFTGGKRGEIVVSDIRQRSIMHSFNAHTSRIRSLTIDETNNTLVTGSIDGELKIWDASTYKLKQAYDIQPRNRFLGTGFNRFPVRLS
ncbi:RAVE protein 1 C terminal-domain-containing protein [Fennellomyces sp. T-0311]|nr:RAVE protein 1 C terminal-domain-containing protein [Fennellomyces sp. T-0311]